MLLGVTLDEPNNFEYWKEFQDIQNYAHLFAYLLIPNPIVGVMD